MSDCDSAETASVIKGRAVKTKLKLPSEWRHNPVRQSFFAQCHRQLFSTLYFMSGVKLMLMCLLWPDDKPDEHIVEVEIDDDDTVASLKDMIKDEYAHALSHIDAHNLVLWKCSGLPDDDNLKQNLKTLQFDGSDNRLVRLTSARQQISKQFGDINLSKEPIHILVMVPPPSATLSPSSSKESKLPENASVLGKRSRDADEPSPELSWLAEVHKKIWGREDLRPKLFRRVEVTQKDYTALQELLKKRLPDRDKQDYSGGNVLDVKLHFLQSLNQVEASRSPHPDARNEDDDNRVDDDDNLEARHEEDDSKASNEETDLESSNEAADSEPVSEDDIVLQSLFPYFLDFLDLSTLELRVKVNKRLPLPLLLRKEYEHISNLIKKRPKDNSGSVIVSGQPGSGKTAYLYLQIIENMIAGRPFLYQANGGTVYHVAKKGVEVVKSWQSDEIIVALFDGDKKGFEPKDFLFGESVQLIVVSSPRITSEKWIKQAGYSFTDLAIKLWSQEELLLTGLVLALPLNSRLKHLSRIFLNRYDLSFKLLRKSTSYFGYDPRQCFAASISLFNLTAEVDFLKLRILEAANDNNFVGLLLSTRSGINDASYKLFQISPNDEDQLLSRCKFEPVSPWAFDQLLQYSEARGFDAAFHFYFLLKRMPEAEALLRHLFERQVLRYLCGISTSKTFHIRGLTDSSEMEWTCHGPIRRIIFKESTFCNELKEAVRNREPVHLVPSIRNFATVDSIIYDPNDPKTALTCIQVTMNQEHDIAVSGLRKIQLWLKSGTPLQDLRPSKERPWRFVFVVPSDKAPKYKLQTLKDDTIRGEWAGKVHQYVLGMKEETIFVRRSSSSVQRAAISQRGEQQMMEVD